MDFGSPANLLRKDIWISFSCTWPLWLVGWLVEYLGVYCQMAMGHSFVRHLLCSRHPGTRSFLGLNDKLANIFTWFPQRINEGGDHWHCRWRTQREEEEQFSVSYLNLCHTILAYIWQGCHCPETNCTSLARLSIVQRACEHERKFLTFKPSTTTIRKYSQYESILSFHKVDSPNFFRNVLVLFFFIEIKSLVKFYVLFITN